MILTAGVAVLHAVATVTAEMIDVMAVEMTDVTTAETIDVTTAVIDATGINIIKSPVFTGLLESDRRGSNPISIKALIIEKKGDSYIFSL